MYWHLIFTKPRQEKCALQNLEQQGYACYLPLLSVEKIYQGILKVTDEPLFPRYLFIRLETGNSAKSWSPIRSTKGVNRLVCFGQEPAKVDNELINLLKAQERAISAQPQSLFTPGERVRLNSGAFAGIEGVYQMASGEGRVMVLIELLSKSVRMRVPPAILCKVR